MKKGIVKLSNDMIDWRKMLEVGKTSDAKVSPLAEDMSTICDVSMAAVASDQV